MSRGRRLEDAQSGTRAAVCLAAVMLGFLGLSAQGAVADLLAEETLDRPADLTVPAQRQADALAHFATGLFEEESEGPEKALESYRHALQLDPGYVDLAIKVSFDYLRRGETAEAISVLKDAAKAAPKNPAPSLAISTIYLRHLRKPDLALKYAQSALEMAPQDLAPYEAVWEVYRAQSQTAKAVQVLEKAARSKNPDPDFWVGLAELHGRTLLRDGKELSPDDMARIAKLLDRAAELGTKDPSALSRIGDLYALIRQVDRAAGFYESAFKLKSTLPDLREKLAACYVELGRTDDAIKVIESISEVTPLNLKAYDQLTQLYLKKGDYAQALINAQRALVLDPQTYERHMRAIDLLLEMNRFAEAAETIAEARRRFPRTGLLPYYHAVALSEAKRHEEAFAVFEQAVTEAMNTQPDLLNGEFYFRYGMAAERAGQFARAGELFKRSIELDPANAARSCNYLGYMWVERNENLAEAEQLIRRALQLEPGSGAYLDSLGWLFFKQGKYAEALTELLRAAEALTEPDAVVFDHIGDTYEKLGQKAEAVLYWQKALQLDPESKVITEKLDKAAEKVAQQPKPKKTDPAPPAR